MAATDNYCKFELGQEMQPFGFQEFFLHHQLMPFRLEYYLRPTILYVFFDKLNQFMIERHDKFVSILKIAPLFGHFVNAVNQLNKIGSEEEFECYLENLLLRHCCYEKRKKRTNYAEYLQFMLALT